MKNKLLKYLLLSLFFIQGTTLVCQTALNQFYLGLRFIPPPNYNLSYLYLSGNNNAFTIREESDLKFSFDRNVDVYPRNFDDFYRKNYPYWPGNISNFNIGYSPRNHLYSTASLMFANEKERSGSYISKMFLADIGIGGYFLKETKDVFKKKNIFNKERKAMMPHKGVLVNALLGYSRGKILHDAYFKSGHASFILNRIYGRIGLDYQARFWGVASSLRFGVLNYGTSIIEGQSYNDLTEQIDLLMTKNNFAFGELSVRFYLGLKYGQIYISRVNTNVSTKLESFLLKNLWSAGAVLDLQEIFRKTKKDNE